MNIFTENFGIIIQVATMLIIFAGYYWKIRIDLKVVDMRINKIEEDRREKWINYGKQKEKIEERLTNQCDKLNEIAINIKSIQVDLRWVKEKIK